MPRKIFKFHRLNLKEQEASKTEEEEATKTEEEEPTRCDEEKFLTDYHETETYDVSDYVLPENSDLRTTDFVVIRFISEDDFKYEEDDHSDEYVQKDDQKKELPAPGLSSRRMTIMMSMIRRRMKKEPLRIWMMIMRIMLKMF